MTLEQEPRRGGKPDQRRTDRHRRQEERHEAQQRRRADADEPQSDRVQYALRERGAQDAVDDPSRGARSDVEEARAPVGRDPLDRRAQSTGGRVAIAKEEIHDQHGQRQLEEALHHAGASREQRRLDGFGQLSQFGHHPRRVVRELRPVRLEAIADERHPGNPGRRIRWPLVDDALREFRHPVGIVGERNADDHERHQHDRRDQQRHHPRGSSCPPTEPNHDAGVQRPRRRREHNGPEHRGQERAQHQEAPGNEHRQQR